MAAEHKKVYMLTPKGNAQLTGGKSSLSAADLSLLVMVDGIANVGQIAQRMPGGGDVALLARRLADLARAGLVADPDASVAIDVKDFFLAADSTLESLQAKGFAVRIARKPQEAPKGAGAGAKKEDAGGKKTVLIVEDDPQLVKLLRMYLQMEEFAVRIAPNGEELVKSLREPPLPDLVLLDVVLPDTDGFHILEKMRGHAGVKDVPVIMATAKATREAVLKGLQLGADGYVTKPYDVAALMTAIKTVLGLK